MSISCPANSLIPTSEKVNHLQGRSTRWIPAIFQPLSSVANLWRTQVCTNVALKEIQGTAILVSVEGKPGKGTKAIYKRWKPLHWAWYRPSRVHRFGHNDSRRLQSNFCRSRWIAVDEPLVRVKLLHRNKRSDKDVVSENPIFLGPVHLWFSCRRYLDLDRSPITRRSFGVIRSGPLRGCQWSFQWVSLVSADNQSNPSLLAVLLQTLLVDLSPPVPPPLSLASEGGHSSIRSCRGRSCSCSTRSIWRPFLSPGGGRTSGGSWRKGVDRITLARVIYSVDHNTRSLHQWVVYWMDRRRWCHGCVFSKAQIAILQRAQVILSPLLPASNAFRPSFAADSSDHLMALVDGPRCARTKVSLSRLFHRLEPDPHRRQNCAIRRRSPAFNSTEV